MLFKNYKSKKNSNFKVINKYSKKMKGGIRSESYLKSNEDFTKSEKKLDELRTKDIQEFQTNITDTHIFSQLELLIKLSLCIAINLNQQFIFNLGKKITDMLLIINNVAEKINSINPEVIPFGVNTLSYQKILENKHLCHNVGLSFNCFTKNQIQNLIKQILFFYINFKEFGVKINKIDQPFFGNNGTDISFAGKFFRALIIILVYLDIEILELKKKKEFSKSKNKEIRTSVNIILEIIFTDFIDNIKEKRDLYILISERSQLSSYFDFLFPTNYSNFSLVFFLCLFPLNNLIDEKIIHSHQHPISKIFKLDKFLEKDNDKNQYYRILLNPISKIELIYPIQCAIINCNYIACKTIISAMNEIKFIQFNSESPKNFEIDVFRGYYHLANLEDIEDGKIPFLETGMIHFNSDKNQQLAELVNGQLNDNIQSVFSQNSIQLIKKFEMNGSVFDNDDSIGVPWQVNPHPSIEILVNDIIPKNIKEINKIISLLHKSTIIEHLEDQDSLLNQKIFVDIKNITNPGNIFSESFTPSPPTNYKKDQSQVLIFNPVTGKLDYLPKSGGKKKNSHSFKRIRKLI